MSTKPVNPQQSRPELRSPISTKPSPFRVFVEKMEKILVEKGESTYKDTKHELGDFIQGIDKQFHGLKEAIKKNDMERAKRHALHLANYSFLAHNSIKDDSTDQQTEKKSA